jgi:hypothetical protein
MESKEDIVMKMNEMLEADKFKLNQFDFLIIQLKELFQITVKFLDFGYFNDKRLKLLKKEKIRLIKIQDFEAAAKIREMEKECSDYISVRTEYNIEKSSFYHDQENLLYFHLGTSKNDKKIKGYFAKSE